MKRHQIRKLIPGNISDAQLRAAVAALNLPVDDDLSYGEQETKWIIDSFKKAAPEPDAGEPTAPAGATGATDATAALNLTRQTIAASTDALQNQALSFATRIQEGDRALAKQVAGFLANRPNQFAIMLAQEIQAMVATPETVDFIDVELATMPSLELPSLSGDSVAVAALGMAR